MAELIADARHAIRAFLKTPGFTLTAVAALALGIGANTAIFSIVNAVLLKPVAFPEPDRMVIFQTTSAQGAFSGASPAKFRHWREQTDIVEDVAAYRANIVNLTGAGLPEQLRAQQVSAEFFELFGVPMQSGRPFTAEEDRPGQPDVVLVSHALWVRRFNQDRTLVGKAIELGGRPHTVIGIVAPSFDFSEFGPQPELFIPFQIDPHTTDQGHYFQAAGRLKPGVSLDQAQAKLKLSAQAYRQQYPTALDNDGAFSATLLQEELVSGARSTLWVLLGAVAFVLLIACANVANLLLARASGRKREIAIRAALGAGRGRLIRQLLTESVLLSVAGGVLGTLLGIVGIRALLAINTADLPRISEGGAGVALDWRVLAFTVTMSLVTGIVFGLIPALHSSRADLQGSLKESSGRSGTGFRQNKTRSMLVVAEVALALVLLIGSALLVRTFVALRSVDPGYDPRGVLTMRMSMSEDKYQKAEAVDQAVRIGVEKVLAIPGVQAASATCCVPLEGGYGLGFTIVGRPLADQPVHGGGAWNTVSPGYFEVFKIPVRRGRTFTLNDTAAAPPVVVINEAMARQFWPNEDPLKDRLTIGRGGMREFAEEPDRQIIGVVADSRDGSLNDTPGPKMWVPQAQVPDLANALNVRITPMAWVVRTEGEPYAFSARIQEALRQATGLPVSNVRAMTEVVSRSTSRQQFNMWLMSVFGLAAMALAAIGIYGLIAYSVEQRTQEIGIRLALGATTSDVRRMVVIQGMLLAIAGVAAGLAASLALARFIASFLFGVEQWDPAVFVGTPVVLALVALVATWLPARRASRVDPIDALRYE
jgi:putative ABC transport system permease protein